MKVYRGGDGHETATFTVTFLGLGVKPTLRIADGEHAGATLERVEYEDMCKLHVG